MTEAEAAKKFCPLADCGSDGNRAMNGEPQDYNRCLCSACMFWGWQDEGEYDGFGKFGRCEAPGGR